MKDINLYQLNKDMIDHQNMINRELNRFEGIQRSLFRRFDEIKDKLLPSLPSSAWEIDQFYWSDGKYDDKKPITAHTKGIIGFIIVLKVKLGQRGCITFPSWEEKYHSDFECVSTAVAIAEDKDKMFSKAIDEYVALRLFKYSPKPNVDK